MIEKILVFESTSYDPYLNIATEKHLFDILPENTLTVFLWQNEKTVVIGRNQNPWTECRPALLEESDGHLARRLSGGGAVFHDLGNLCFTFIARDEDYSLTKNLEVIKAACKKAGINAEFTGRNDLVADGRKFSGNAFYSSDGKTCHHGTILIKASSENMSRFLTPSKAKLSAKGVQSVRSRVVNLSELVPTLTPDLMKQFVLLALPEVLNIMPELCDEIPHGTVAKKRAELMSKEWLYGTTLPFTAAFEGAFSWGEIKLHFDVKKGIVSTLTVYTDAMDADIAFVIQNALSGIEYKKSAIAAAIRNALGEPVAEDIIGIINIE